MATRAARVSPADAEQEEVRPLGLAQLAQSYSYEGLDDEDWAELPYVPPDLERARDQASESVFEGKRAHICGTSIRDLSTMGAGVSLWFRFLRYSAIFMVLASVRCARRARPELGAVATARRELGHLPGGQRRLGGTRGGDASHARTV